MRWFWQRKKPATPAASANATAESFERPARVTSPRAAQRTHPLQLNLEPRDAILAFARDLLNAQGARVRVEEDVLVTAAFPDSKLVRYTTSLSRARAEESTALLTQGAPALDSLFEIAERRARLTAATLTVVEEPVALALRMLSNHAMCGQCVAVVGGESRRGRGACDACPLRTGTLALRWESPPTGGHVLQWEQETSIELTYRVTSRDRRGRLDEWLRFAFDPSNGQLLPLLSIERLTTAHATDALEHPPIEAIRATTEYARKTLTPSVEALAAFRTQHVAADYQRRVEDLTTTSERFKRERPAEIDIISSSLARDLAALAEVYGVEVEAALESACIIVSPVALVSMQTALDAGPTVRVDAGRGALRSPTCMRCAQPVSAGRVCASGHVYCAACAEACSRCGNLRCAACGDKALSACGLCREKTCQDCTRACDTCQDLFCADHVWTCVAGDRTLCLRHLTLCDECQAPLCETHAATCARCDTRLCPQHIQRCAADSEPLCAKHAGSCVTCERPLCAPHATTCAECGQPVCPADLQECSGCGRVLCACANLTPCATCGVPYCARCHAGTPACPACRALAPASESDLALLRSAAGQDPAIALKRPWLVGQNTRARVFVSRGLGREEAVVLSAEGDIIVTHRKGWRA